MSNATSDDICVVFGARGGVKSEHATGKYSFWMANAGIKI